MCVYLCQKVKSKKNESLILQYSEDNNLQILISGIRKLYPIEMELAINGCCKMIFQMEC